MGYRASNMFIRNFRQILNPSRTLRILFGPHLRRRFATVSVQNSCAVNLATQLLFVCVGSAAMAAPEESQRPKRKRSISKIKHRMSLEGKSQHYLNALKVRWVQLHDIPGIFAYQLNAQQGRFLTGKHHFYAELNTDRTMRRRLPQAIETLNPPFKPKQFNFNKVDALEVMLTIDHNEREVQLIVNKSPITQFHSLVCPEVKRNLVQRITAESLDFCITFLRSIDDSDMRMGYNSPGALASVNHLHFHLVRMPHKLYIDTVELEELAGGYAYRLSPNMPTEGICFEFGAGDDPEVVRAKQLKLHQLTEWLCYKNLPHNIFITHDRRKGKSGDVLAFVFARCKYCVIKEVTAFNVGFCELAGYIPVGDEERLKQLTESEVIERIRDVTGDAYGEVYEQVKNIVNETVDPSAWEQPTAMTL